MKAILNNNKVTISIPKKDSNKYFVLNNMNRKKISKLQGKEITYSLRKGDSLITKISNKKYCQRKIVSMHGYDVQFVENYLKPNVQLARISK